MDRIAHIHQIADKIATGLFIMMLNPNYRGPNFDFETFDIESFVESTSSMSFEVPLTESEKDILKRSGRLHWDEMVKTSSVLTWVDLQKKDENQSVQTERESKLEIRIQRIKEYLAENGPSHCASIWRDLEIPRGSIYTVLRNGPFVQLPNSQWMQKE